MRQLSQAEIYRYQATGELPDDYEPPAEQTADGDAEVREQPIGDVALTAALPAEQTAGGDAGMTEQPIVPPAPDKKGKK